MTETKYTPMNGDDAMDDIGQLVRFAGQRESVNDERMGRARERVGSHWQDVVEQRQRQRRFSRNQHFAIAASIVAVVGFAFMQWPVISGADQPVMVDRVSGHVTIDGRPVSNGDVIATHSTIVTGNDGRIALTFPVGQSVRLDTDTEITVQASDHIALAIGGVYIDSGPATEDAYIAVATRFGVATDIGTQFQVRVGDEQMQVGVREGLVELSRPDAALLTIDSGNLLELSVNGSEVGRRIASNDPVWSWVGSISPAFEIEGVTLEDYLNWYTREVGLEIEWQDTRSLNLARLTRLSGSIDGMSLDNGLELVRLIAPFEARLSGWVLYISVE